MARIRIFAFFFLLLLGPYTAHAYVDPGSGALFLQALAAIGIGILFYFRQAINLVKSWFNNQSQSPENKPDGSNSSDE